MWEYGPLLKKLMAFTGVKMADVADLLNYDLSYISKWCNQSKLPAARNALKVNQSLAALFAREIRTQEKPELFAKAFSVSPGPNELETVVQAMLDEGYRSSVHKAGSESPAACPEQIQLLTQLTEIRSFFQSEFPAFLRAETERSELLCTMDLFGLIMANGEDLGPFSAGLSEVHLKCAIDQKRFLSDPENLLSLYSWLNRHHSMAMELYDDSRVRAMNTIVVKGKAVVLCSLDPFGRITAAVVIRDLDQVDRVYLKVQSAFHGSERLLHSAEGGELTQNSFRTEFYSRDAYQIFTARGFEFLLPEACWAPIIAAAQRKEDGGATARITAKMQITWEEIFEKRAMDFYLTKSALLQYLEDGEIVFLDVPYHMSVGERKLHFERVLEMARQNPDIRFFVIDDDQFPGGQFPHGISLYSNRRRIFLKKLWHFQEESGSTFLFVDSELWVRAVVDFLDALKEKEYCYAYDSEELQHFSDRYGTMLMRMLDLNEGQGR